MRDPVYRLAYQERNKSRIALYRQEYNIKNIGKIRAKQAKYISENKAEKIAYDKIYSANNAAKKRAATKQWAIDNPEKARANARLSQSNRRASKLRATPAWANKSLIKEIYFNCPDGYEVDHAIPLQGKSVCGLHVEFNLQYLPKLENRRKSASLLEHI